MGLFCKFHQLPFDLFLLSLAQLIIGHLSRAICRTCIQFSAIRLRSFVFSIKLIGIFYAFFDEFSTFPDIDRQSFKRGWQPMWVESSLEGRIKVCLVISTLQERFDHFKSINFLMNQTLSLLWWKLVFVYRLEHLMDTCGTLLLGVIYDVALLNPVQTPHNCSLD